MRKSTRPLVIASRSSLLARAQTQMVARLLSEFDPTLKIELRFIESPEDPNAAAPAGLAGVKDVFVRAVQQALLREEADLAVHSFKDVPMVSAPGLTVAAVPTRADCRDCLVSAAGHAAIDDLPPGARVGTGSPRRAAQLRRRRPDLVVEPLRGNVDTRLRKVLEEKEVDAALLAVAGLQRAGLGQHAGHPIDPEVILPAPAQGALALQCRVDDHVTIRRCLPLNDPTTALCVNAERQLAGALGADCHGAVAVLVEPTTTPPDPGVKRSRQDQAAPHFQLRARVLSAEGQRCLEARQVGAGRHVGRMVRGVVADLRRQGAEALLQPGAGQ